MSRPASSDIKMAVLLVVLGLSVLLALILHGRHERTQCRHKGGSYIQGQCLRVETIP